MQNENSFSSWLSIASLLFGKILVLDSLLKNALYQSENAQNTQNNKFVLSW